MQTTEPQPPVNPNDGLGLGKDIKKGWVEIEHSIPTPAMNLISFLLGALLMTLAMWLVLINRVSHLEEAIRLHDSYVQSLRLKMVENGVKDLPDPPEAPKKGKF